MATNIGYLQAVLGLSTTQLDAGLNRANAALMKFSNRLKTVGKTMSMALTLPMVGIGVGAVKLAADFEKSMSKIVGLVGVAASEVNAMRGEVMKMAGATSKAPNELADALFFVTSAGLRGKDAMDVLRVSAQAAASGLGETKVVADLVTSAVNAYGIRNLSAAKATDILVAAVREGKAEAVALAPALGQVLPITSAMGVSFDQVGAAVAAMTRTGTEATTATMQLKNILNSILAPTQQAEEALQAMGKSSMQLRQEIRDKGLLSVLQWLATRVHENQSAAESFVTSMGSAFPNIRALSGALDLMGSNVEDNVGIFNRMKDTTGALDNAFAAASQTASFKFNQALAEIKATGIELGNLLIPLAVKIANGIKTMVTGFTRLSSQGKKVVLAIAGIVALAGPTLAFLGTMGTIMAGLISTTGLVVLAIAALGAAILYIWDNWAAIKERITDWAWWRNALIDMAQFLLKWNFASLIIKGFNVLIKAIPEAWKKVTDFITNIAWWREMVMNMFDFFEEWSPLGLLVKAVNALTGMSIAIDFDTEAVDKAKADTESLKDLIAAPFTIPDPFEGMSNGLEGLRGETQTYQHEFKTFGESVKSVAGQVRDALGRIFDGVTAGGMTSIGGEIQSAVSLPRMVGKGSATGAVEGAAEQLRGGGKPAGAPGTAAPVLTEAMVGQNLAQRLQAVSDKMMSIKDSAVELGTAVQNTLNSAFIELGETLGSIFSGDGGAGSFFDGLISIVASFMKTLGQAIIAAGTAALVFESNLFGNPVVAIAAGIALVAAAAVVQNLLKKGPAPQGLVAGGLVTSGGVFKVGEKGEELVSLPRGSAVSPMTTTGGGQMIHVTGEIVGDGDELRVIIRESERKRRNIN